MPVGTRTRIPHTDPPTSATTKGLPRAQAPLLATAHLTVLAAVNQNDPAAQSVIAATVAKAERGDPDAMAVAQVLDQASKIHKRAQYAHFWRYGEGARKVGG